MSLKWQYELSPVLKSTSNLISFWYCLSHYEHLLLECSMLGTQWQWKNSLWAGRFDNLLANISYISCMYFLFVFYVSLCIIQAFFLFVQMWSNIILQLMATESNWCYFGGEEQKLHNMLNLEDIFRKSFQDMKCLLVIHSTE